MDEQLLTIGAFARAARLSAKALRLYDELGLLTPAQVDARSGYRFYAPEQLDRARLVAWLRRLGMPLTRIRDVCALDPAAAAREVAGFWIELEAETSARRDLAAFLVAHLSGAGAEPAQVRREEPLEIRYAVRSELGLVRAVNQDTAHASGRLLAVADGFGPHGAPASAAAVESLVTTTAGPGLLAGDLLNGLQDAVLAAQRAVEAAGTAGAGASVGLPDAELLGTGTTLTALIWTGRQLALVHLGDSRAYLYRAGALFRITHDHTLVQAMVDAGQLTAEEADSHPQRMMLIRSLFSGNAQAPAPELRLQDARPGDRYLLCSDGLSRVVPEDEIRSVIAGAADPEQGVTALVGLALAAGAPDNVSCVLADVQLRADRGSGLPALDPGSGSAVRGDQGLEPGHETVHVGLPEQHLLHQVADHQGEQGASHRLDGQVDR